MLKLNKILGKLKLIVPALYMLGAIPVWFVFSKSNPDGLANLGLVFYTYPIIAIGTFILNLEFPYFPGNYYVAHALYFLFSVVFLAVILFLIFHGLQKFTKSNQSLKRDT
jgi:hypothetical protein